MSQESPDNKDQTAGHRARLLERYVGAGVEALGDYERLELLLTYALPRIDTKPIAKKLLERYGSMTAVLNTPLDELCAIEGLGRRSAALLTLTGDLIAHCLSEAFEKKPVINHFNDMVEYLRFRYGHCRDEFFAAIFLDGGNSVIDTEIVSEGTVSRAVVFPRKVMQRAIKCGAASFIVAHNHPAGTAVPSESDWQITERLMSAGHCLEIRLVDHVIISKDNAVSMKQYDRWGA